MFSSIVIAYCLLFLLRVSSSTFSKDQIDGGHMRGYSEYSKSNYSNQNKDEETAKFWIENAEATIRKQLARKQNIGKAKNVILFLGDGMSLSTLAAARVYLGGQNKKTGEETELSFEKFSHVGLAKTYCVNKQVADSACTATAYLSGIKANFETIGVTAAVEVKDCNQMKNISNHVFSVAKDFQLNGRRTGIVTTSSLTDASPAGVYAHTAFRDWESDTDVLKDKVDPTECRDIAHQLVHGDTGRNLNVIFGGGRWAFYPNTTIDEEGNPGYRSDGRHLVEEWKQTKSKYSNAYITDRSQLLELSNQTDYVLGMFDSSHIPYNLDRNLSSKPSLEEMTEKAIRLLSVEDEGYFLFVEGARIDMAHHGSLGRKALDETVEFHKAVETAVRMTETENTLIIVTSDHSHTLSINGYPSRRSDILGFGGKSDTDNLPYSTISYANGPGYKKETNGVRYNISKDDLKNKNYEYPSMVPLGGETHGGDDVGIFAEGPWAHLLSGVLEQHVIPHIIRFATCLSNFNACNILNQDL